MKTNKLKELKLISPRDIKEGEKINLWELLSSENILNQYEKITEEIALEKAQEQIIKIKENLEKENYKKIEEYQNLLRKNFEEQKELFSKSMEEKEKRIKYESKEIIEREKQFSRKEKDSLNIQLSEAKEGYKLLEDTLKEIKDIYNKNLKDELIKLQDKLQKEHEINIVNLTKEYEDKAKSATRIGADAEEEIRGKLTTYFPSDDIIEPNASIGEADVLHKIKEQGKEVATIYYEIKNRKNWSKPNYDNFADKVRRGKHTFNIFISAELPKKSPEQHIKHFEGSNFLYDEINNIYITTFENWLPVIVSLRNNAIAISKLNNYKNNEKTIQQQVYDFFKSSEFENYFARIQNNISNSKKYMDAIKQNSIKGSAEIERIWFELENLKSQLDVRSSTVKKDKIKIFL